MALDHAVVPTLRSHRSSPDLSRLSAASLALALALGALSGTASAQSVRLNQYAPPMLADDGLQMSRPIALDRGSFSLLLVFDYSNDPLVLELESGLVDTERAHLVENHVGGGFRVGYGVLDRVSLSAGIDFIPLMNGDEYRTPGSGRMLSAADGAGLADAHLGARWLVAGDAKSLGAFGIQGALGLPLAAAVASDQRFSGEDGLSFRPEFLAEIRPGSFRFSANVGILLRNGVEIFDTTLGSAFTYGAGAAVNLASGRIDLDLLAEVYGSTSIDQAFERGSTPLEAIAGARLRPGKLIRVTAAAGPGLQRGIGSPDFRALASVAIMTEREVELDANDIRVCAGGASVSGDEICPDADRDGDQIADARDDCPDEAEDADGHRDEDGCADRDDDGDSVDDASDRCRGEAEDQDGFQDSDGCPDLDDDADLVADQSDRCPRDAEDRDGFEDDDGCPELDNDRDGVPDAQDDCPLLPGSAAQRGCATVTVEAGQLKLSQRIEFAPNKNEILAVSNSLMEDIRAALEKHPEVQLVAVEGHTDSRGSAARNRALSKRRAEAVVAWLANHGITLDRLQAWGCGPNRPLESNETEAGRQQNRRVEFHILVPPPDKPHDLRGCERAGKLGSPRGRASGSPATR